MSIATLVLAASICLSGASKAWAQPAYCSPSDALISEQDERPAVELFQREGRSVVQVYAFKTTMAPQGSPDRVFFPGNEFDSGGFNGSGFIWDNQGHVITNAHVVLGASRFEVVTIDERITNSGATRRTRTTRYNASLVGGSTWHDLAVLKIDARPENLHPVSVGSSLDLNVGQRVYAIGSPFEEHLSRTLTVGIVSGLRRHIPLPDPSDVVLFNMIQTDASISPGNSGGPLLDGFGRVVGVNTSGLGETLNFAIPVNTVCRVVPELIETGFYSRPRLGASFPLRSFTPEGIYFMRIDQGSNAETAGLRGGMPPTADIIQQIAGNTVRTVDDLWRILDYYRPGDQVDVQVLRDGNDLGLTVSLSEGADRGDPLRRNAW